MTAAVNQSIYSNYKINKTIRQGELVYQKNKYIIRKSQTLSNGVQLIFMFVWYREEDLHFLNISQKKS